MSSYQQTLRALRPIITPVFESIKKGLNAANQAHGPGGFSRRRDPHYYAHTVRRTAADVLREQGLLAEADQSDRPELGLSGLLIRHDGVALRILRSGLSAAGQVVIPIPGRSEARQAFWRQESALPGMEADNILLLWRDEVGELVEPMFLIRPLGGTYRRDSLIIDWTGRLTSGMAYLRAADLDELQPDMVQGQLGNETSG
jgi:hypothetical protein